MRAFKQIGFMHMILFVSNNYNYLFEKSYNISSIPTVN